MIVYRPFKDRSLPIGSSWAVVARKVLRAEYMIKTSNMFAMKSVSVIKACLPLIVCSSKDLYKQAPKNTILAD